MIKQIIPLNYTIQDPSFGDFFKVSILSQKLLKKIVLLNIFLDNLQFIIRFYPWIKCQRCTVILRCLKQFFVVTNQMFNAILDEDIVNFEIIFFANFSIGLVCTFF
jgi:hypothetical protein